MSRQFLRVKLSSLDQQLAINASDIRAVLPLGGDRYQIWLSSDFEISSEIGKRLSKLAGVTTLSKDSWEVHSSDLADLFN
jgi:hypothetical protein